MTGSRATELLALLPEILLLAGAVGGLLLGLWTPQRRQGRVAVLTLTALGGAAAAAAAGLAGGDRVVFSGTWTVDAVTGVVRLSVALATAGFVVLARARFAGHPRETEVYVLGLLGAIGASALAASSDLLLLAAAYLLASVPLYALAGFVKDARAVEASLKYYLMGALVGVLMLVGVAALVLATGRTGYAALAVGLAEAPRGLTAVGVLGLLAGVAFKAGAVPVHFWVPDVTAGTTPAVGAFLTTVPKVGAVAAAFRLLAEPFAQVAVDVTLVVALLAAASMTLGNLAAFRQDDPLRLLAYSAISQVGYLFMVVAVAGRTDVAVPALAVYLVGYAVTNVGAFAAVAALPGARTISDWATGVRHRPWVVLSLTVALLGLVGTPPTVVFVGKLAVFTATGDGGLMWLVVVGAVNTVASLFYYLRWLAPAFRAVTEQAAPGPRDVPAPLTMAPAAVLHCSAAGAVVLGIAAGRVALLG
ncbi:NADH-quinone oxidoreductase subunit N [Kineosporiaceae bacterium SCSIO 59966]|nr:NADH-quinone oxidoreductase subunit N [Kineosporiaceae bacterium SCSIO 59966]